MGGRKSISTDRSKESNELLKEVGWKKEFAELKNKKETSCEIM